MHRLFLRLIFREGKRLKRLKLSILQNFNDKCNRKDFAYQDFNVTKEEYFDIIRELDREGLIDNVFYADDEPYSLANVYVTNEGKDFLEKNKLTHKVKKAVEFGMNIIK